MKLLTYRIRREVWRVRAPYLVVLDAVVSDISLLTFFAFRLRELQRHHEAIHHPRNLGKVPKRSA